ncbi:MAG: YraN family protein [Desulfobulbaceae bacterium DB1]|nr:MAG: YraN family protein [Desulfobulbaceae bacterium DB1]
MTFQRQSLGKKGEEIARKFLRRQGYTIIEHNFRTRNGEIDIIAREGATLVFVEVKTRSDARFGSPFEAVTTRKCKTISRVALEYLLAHGGLDQPCRFDVVSVRPGENPEVEIVRNAFEIT